jgi:PAS domain S-box-containing protein
MGPQNKGESHRIMPRQLIKQVALLTSLMLVLGTAALTSFMINQMTVVGFDNAKDKLGAIAENIGLGISEQLVIRNYAGVEQLLLRSANFPGIRHITATDASGRILSAVNRDPGKPAKALFNVAKLSLPQIKADHFAWRYGTSEQANRLYFGLDATELILWHPIENGDLGWLKISISVEDVRNDAFALIKASLLFTLITLLALIWTLYRLLQPSLHAIGEAANFAHSLTTVDGRQLSVYSGTSETEQLGRALNMASQHLHMQDTALRESRESLKRLLDSMAEGAYGIDVNGICTFVNPAFLSMLKFDNSNEIIGKHVHSLIHHTRADGSSYPAQECKIYRANAMQQMAHVDDEVFWRTDQVAIPVEYWSNPLMHEGTQVGTIVTFIDITERKRIEKMKSEFISTVSHELRTPLTSINGALGLLSGGAVGEIPEQAKKMIEMAKRNSLRLSSLINDLLDIDKLLAGKMKVDLQDQPLMPLVEQSLESIQTYGEQYQVGFKLIAREDVQVRVDGARLIQVLNNFLSNAAKFSPQGGQVEILVRIVNSFVRVEIIDHGAGVPAEFKDRIFQKFSQADSSDSRKKGGTGLGLAISKELIEQMNGTVGFDSVEGQKTSFYFELPLLES